MTFQDSSQNSTKKQIDEQVKNYVDPITGFSTQQLEAGYWFETHKQLFKKIIAGVLIVVDAVLIVYSLYGWGNHFFIGSSATRQILFELSRPGVESTIIANRAAYAPKEIQVISSNVLYAFGDKYDFVVEVVNPNPEWYVTFDWRFNFRGGETPWRTSFLLPGENSVRGELGFEFQTRPREPALEFKNIKWKRISPHLTAKPLDYIKERIAFEVKAARFLSGTTNSSAISRSAGYGQNTIHFSIINNTPFSYYAVPFLVVMGKEGLVAGVETVTLEPFLSGQELTIDLATNLSGSFVEQIRVLPVLDVFNDSVYKKPGA